MTRNTMVNVASLTQTSHHKRRETINKLIMLLPPHGRQGCITYTRENETIDELIKRIPTSEGLYKMHGILSKKADSLELYKNERKLTRAKGCSALDRAMHLLAIEQNIVPNTRDHNFAHSCWGFMADSRTSLTGRVNLGVSAFTNMRN